MAADRVNVVRDGQTLTIDSKDLCKGDLVKISSGEKIPADLRVLKSINFKVEQSSLTGESDEVTKLVEKTSEVSRFKKICVLFYRIHWKLQTCCSLVRWR
jgi:P-type E1-E2 ATPase